jgi:hypothetical protein
LLKREGIRNFDDAPAMHHASHGVMGAMRRIYHVPLLILRIPPKRPAERDGHEALCLKGTLVCLYMTPCMQVLKRNKVYQKRKNEFIVNIESNAPTDDDAPSSSSSRHDDDY